MPMDYNSYDEIMNKLNDPELSHEDRGRLLTDLRTDYNNVIEEYENLSTEKGKLEEEKADLVNTNSQLFREWGKKNAPQGGQPSPEEKQKTLSETISLDDFGKSI